MALRSLPTAQEVLRFAKELNPHESALQKKLRMESSALGVEALCVDPDQAAVLLILAWLTDAREVLELGASTGYNSLRIAQTLSGIGRLTACECVEKWADVSARYWRRAKVAPKVRPFVGPVSMVLSALKSNGEDGGFDLVIIGGAHVDSVGCYESSLELVCKGGLVVLVGVTPIKQPAGTPAMRRAVAIAALRMNIRRDPRVEGVLLEAGGGILLARKR